MSCTGKPRAQGHADAVAGVDMGVGGGGVDPAGAASGEYGGLGFHVDGFAGFHADGNNADHGAVLVLHDIRGVPLVEEHGVVFHVALVEGMQQRVTGAVRRRAGAGRRLPALTKVLGLAPERTLVDTPLFRAGERQTHVFQLEHRLGTHTAHVLDGVLVADIVGTPSPCRTCASASHRWDRRTRWRR